MAVGVSNFDESDFEEYNPHPYRGGYDISLTYGEPLPPSSAICYPLSGASSPPPPPQVTAEPLTNGEPKPVPPEAEERAIPSSFVPGADKLPYEYGSSNDYIERGYDLRDWWSRFAGFSPFILAEDGNGHGGRRSYDAEELKFWSRWRRAADFIFGYPQGYGERKIGVDSCGVPIYAYKCNGFDALQVQLEPARTEKIDYHSGFLDPERYKVDEFYRLNNPKHHSDNFYQAEVDPVESVFSWDPSHQDFCEEQLYSDSNWNLSSYHGKNDAVLLNGNHEIVYDLHYDAAALHVQLGGLESSFQKVTHHEESPPYGDPPDLGIISGNSYHVHENYNHQQSSHVELEPYISSLDQFPGLYKDFEGVYTDSKPVYYSEAYDDSVFPTSGYQTPSSDAWGNGRKLIDSSEYEYEKYDDDHLLNVELEPFKPTWAQNPNYYDIYGESSAQLKQDDGSYGFPYQSYSQY